MSLVDRARVEIKLGKFGVAPASALTDPLLLAKVQEYRRQAAARLQPIPREDIPKRMPAGSYHVSRKIDGEFSVLVVQGDEALCVNPGGTVRVGLPFEAEAIARVKKAGLSRAVFAGELHVARPDGKRARVHDVGKVARQPQDEAELDTLRFTVFDVIEPAAVRFEDTWKRITDLFGGGERITAVEAVICKTPEEIQKRFSEWVEKDGDEGIVVRSDQAGSFKVKPKHSIDAVIVGFTEGTEDRRGMIHDLLVALVRPGEAGAPGTFHLLGRVGGGFTEDDRRAFFADLGDAVAESEYAEVNSDHVAYRMVRPEIVIELSVLDVVATTTRGAPIDRMVLTWNTKVGAGRWDVVRRLPLASLISPNYVRRRTDKRVDAQDLRLEQLTDLVEIPGADRDATKVQLGKSEVLRREAYTKVMKGQTLVRKLVLWKTNKEQDSPDHPAFVLAATDFSPNRKTMLEREVRVSSTRVRIDALWDELAKEYFTKGWTKV